MFFGNHPSARVTYWKYPDRATLTAFTGVEANALNAGGEIHSIWPTEPHELAHLFAGAWGDPPSFLAEGVAVYFSGQWQSQSIGEAAGAVLSAGRWIPIRDLLDTRAFRALPSPATYAVAGALAQWIDQKRGHEMLRALYAGLHDNRSSGENASQFATILGMDVDAADRSLCESLAGGLASPRTTPR